MRSFAARTLRSYSSARNPDAFTAGAHLAASSALRLASSSGVLPTGSRPSPSSRLLTSEALIHHAEKVTRLAGQRYGRTPPSPDSRAATRCARQRLHRSPPPTASANWKLATSEAGAKSSTGSYLRFCVCERREDRHRDRRNHRRVAVRRGVLPAHSTRTRSRYLESRNSSISRAVSSG
jgi:hypothetical protein